MANGRGSGTRWEVTAVPMPAVTMGQTESCESETVGAEAAGPTKDGGHTEAVMR